MRRKAARKRSRHQLVERRTAALSSDTARSARYQVSSGGVVFKRSSTGIRICLIARRTKVRLIWCLPKGHVEKMERLEQAALREVKEETGISGRIFAPLGFIQYTFFDLEMGKQIFKTVHFFLLRYIKGRLSDHDDEAEFARWFSAPEAAKRVEYPSERKVLKKALHQLKIV